MIMQASRWDFCGVQLWVQIGCSKWSILEQQGLYKFCNKQFVDNNGYIMKHFVYYPEINIISVIAALPHRQLFQQ